MAYTKQNFEDGQVLNAEHLNKMEDGIVNQSWNDLKDKPFVVVNLSFETMKLDKTPAELLEINISGGAALFSMTMTPIAVDTDEDRIVAVHTSTVMGGDVDGNAMLFLHYFNFSPDDGSFLGASTAMWDGGTVIE